MQNFVSVKGFATRQGAVDKLVAVVGDNNLGFYHWHVGVTPTGRFFPVVTGSVGDEYQTIGLAHLGICVTG